VGAYGRKNRIEASSEVGTECMAAKGYLLVREDEVEAKRQELEAAAAQKAR
jgi:hypothetical protein